VVVSWEGESVYARIATFEGGDPAQIDVAIEGIRGQSESEMPEGMEGAREFLMLVDRQSGKSLGIVLFDSEESMRRGDEVLNQMSPPVPEGTGRRTGVEMYEVAIREQVGG
jgi:hypothetical protein